MLIGLQMIPAPGWHGYWSNPGESGLAPNVRWSAPQGIHFGPLEHPAPTIMQVMGLTSYVHVGPHLLLVKIRLDAGVPLGTDLPISAEVNLAACSDRLCVPERERLSLHLKAGSGGSSPDAAKLKEALANAPRPVAGGTFEVHGGSIILLAPQSVHLDPLKARFFPDENGYWNAGVARIVSRNPLRIAGPKKGGLPKTISGVLSDGRAAYQITFRGA